MTFRQRQIAALSASGWANCPSIARAVREAGLPPVSAKMLAAQLSVRLWTAAERAVDALRRQFASARFADEAAFGLLLVPDPARLDTRRTLAAEVRRDQLGRPSADVFDPRLPAGRLAIAPGRDWTLIATIVGPYGLSLGSYDEVTGAPRAAFTVEGEDTRALMLRQIWGARVLQGGATPPDCEANDRWTFTIFAGEPLVDGEAESGTVLKGKVRFRLGKRNRGIGPARVAPGLLIR